MEVESTAARIDEKSVNPSYSFISEAFRHVTAGPLQCSVFCGGKACKYERSDFWEIDQMAIPGLFSHWVTDTILAMARLNYTEMKKNNMIDSFKKQNIKTVINLQENGEHASCGMPLHSSGFSYDPQELMDNDIFYYNFNIQDYSVPLQRTLLDICKVVSFAQTEGGVAIHCHAGLGRTGVVIACFLIYHHKMKPKDAILLVRKNRPRSIQTRNQLKAVFKFALYLAPLWHHFPTSSSRGDTLDVILEKQKKVLHGEEGRTLKYIPKVVFVICSGLIAHTGHSSAMLCKRFHPLSPSRRPMTCQPALEWETRDVEDDLDSLSGEDNVEGCTNDLSEVEEMEAQMTPRSRDDDTTAHPIANKEVEDQDDTTAPAITCKEGEDQGETSDIKPSVEPKETPLRRCVSASAILIHDHKGVTEEQEISLQLCHRLHLSPRTSFDHDNKKKAKRPLLGESLWPFLAGILGEDNTEETKSLCDIDTVIRQINVGIWESVLSLSLYQQGALLRRWIENLAGPLLTPRQVDTMALLDVEGLSEAVDRLPPSSSSIIHCLCVTFSALLYGPLLTRREEVQRAINVILSGGNNTIQDFARSRQLMGNLLKLKYRDIQL